VKNNQFWSVCLIQANTIMMKTRVGRARAKLELWILSSNLIEPGYLCCRAQTFNGISAKKCINKTIFYQKAQSSFGLFTSSLKSGSNFEPRLGPISNENFEALKNKWSYTVLTTSIRKLHSQIRCGYLTCQGSDDMTRDQAIPPDVNSQSSVRILF